MTAVEIDAARNFDQRVDALDDFNQRADLIHLGRTFKILCEEAQAKSAVRCMDKLAKMIEAGTYVKDGERYPINIRTMARAVQAHAEIYSRYLELATAAEGGNTQNVNIMRQSLNVSVDQSVIEERARVMAEEIVRKRLLAEVKQR